MFPAIDTNSPEISEISDIAVPAVSSGHCVAAPEQSHDKPDHMDELVRQFPPISVPPEYLSGTSGIATLNADAHGFGDAALTSWISEGSLHSSWRLMHRARGAYLRAVLGLGEGNSLDDHATLSDGEFRARFKGKYKKLDCLIRMTGTIRGKTIRGDLRWDVANVPAPRSHSFRGERISGPGIAKPGEEVLSPLPNIPVTPRSIDDIFGNWQLSMTVPDGRTRDSVLSLFQEHGKKQFLEMFGQEVDTETTEEYCITTFNAYNEYELKQEHGRIPRILSRARAVGIYSTPRRPRKITIPQSAHDWADEFFFEFRKHGLRKCVLLYPNTCYKSREWPPSYWNDLGWALFRLGIGVAFMHGSEKDDRHTNVPRFLFGVPWENSAALMLRSDLVIGNDSGPVNIAGTLGVNTLALMGPTNPLIFAHLPEVHTMSVDEEELSCVRCHFQFPFRSACDQGCQALYRLHPENVFGRVLDLIGEPASMPEQLIRPRQYDPTIPAGPSEKVESAA